MQLKRWALERRTTGGCDIIDLTDEVRRLVADSGVREGLGLVFAPGSTAGITTIEYESGVVEDLRQALERLVPQGMEYSHDARWGDGNGYSHVRASLLGPSFAFPVEEGRPVLGTWQQIVLVDMDNRPRTRELVLQVMGA